MVISANKPSGRSEVPEIFSSRVGCVSGPGT